MAIFDNNCHFAHNQNMSSSLNIQLTTELRRYVDERASDHDLYATPSEYIRDLIRRDMEDQAVLRHVISGLNDFKQGRFSSRSILDIGNEE